MLRLDTILASSRCPSTPLDPLLIQALPAHQPHLAPSLAFTRSLDASVLSGSSLTQSALLSLTPSTALAHFYGHVGFDETAPLDHHLDSRGIPSERVTARDVFGTKVQPGALVTMVGCGSRTARIGLHDDFLGLATAWHYAGAGSIAITL
ncbi:MAG: hypothetical protein MMC23_003088 [Stictis urceolatum]|nr:hypothetical protein [Stictis urceolata]